MGHRGLARSGFSHRFRSRLSGPRTATGSPRALGSSTWPASPIPARHSSGTSLGSSRKRVMRARFGTRGSAAFWRTGSAHVTIASTSAPSGRQSLNACPLQPSSRPKAKWPSPRGRASVARFSLQGHGNETGGPDRIRRTDRGALCGSRRCRWRPAACRLVEVTALRGVPPPLADRGSPRGAYCS